MKKNKQKTIKSFEELARAISFGSIGEKQLTKEDFNALPQYKKVERGGVTFHLQKYDWNSEITPVFNSLVDELEEHNKKVKQRIKNYDRL